MDSRSKWQAVVDVLSQHYENPDIGGARVVCASVAAHTLKQYPPAWCLIIAPPGSMKTDLVESLRGLKSVYLVDEITPKTFISGKIDDYRKNKKGRAKPAGLLHRLGSDILLVAADFSTFTANPKTLSQILPQLRRIYDGNLTREFGSDENLEERSWSGRLTFLASATPDVDKHYALFQSLGERFIRVRWNRAGGVSTGLRAMRHNPQVALDLKNAVQGVLGPIFEQPQQSPTIPAAFEMRIAALSELVVLARAYVERDRSRQQTGLVIAEGNTRLPQQLAQLARGSALLDGRSEINEQDYRVVVRAAFDSLLPARLMALKRIARTGKPYATATETPSAVIARAIEDLQHPDIGMLTSNGDLSEHAKALLKQAGLNPKSLEVSGIEYPASETITRENKGVGVGYPQLRETLDAAETASLEDIPEPAEALSC
ncbi:MAG TPA: hypothetical protein VJN69_14420 [Candidatus Acidoferrales bacterium]|nr:hypothetical protein [Candidatus Acidoferrales bacterium]